MDELKELKEQVKQYPTHSAEWIPTDILKRELSSRKRLKK